MPATGATNNEAERYARLIVVQGNVRRKLASRENMRLFGEFMTCLMT